MGNFYSAYTLDGYYIFGVACAAAGETDAAQIANLYFSTMSTQKGSFPPGYLEAVQQGMKDYEDGKWNAIDPELDAATKLSDYNAVNGYNTQNFSNFSKFVKDHTFGVIVPTSPLPPVYTYGSSSYIISNFKIESNMMYPSQIDKGEWADSFDNSLFGNVKPHYEPLVIDLSGTGIQTTSVANGVYFDLQNDGFQERTAWVAGQTGILVYDPGGGAITNGSQLFGTATSLSGGYAIDGFAALSAQDSNSDGVINSSDTNWSNLYVWTDSNGNGVVDSGELKTLSASGVASVSLSTTNTDTTDANGNFIGKTATFNKTGGGTGEVADLTFLTNPIDTIPDAYLTLSSAIQALPDISGFGTVSDLSQAIQSQANAGNTTLETYVQDFVAATSDVARNTLVDEIIYQWTGVQSVSPTSRGGYVNAQQLDALEKLNGISFVDPYNGTSNPGVQAAQPLIISYQQLHDFVLATLEAQTDLSSLFDDIQQTVDSSDHIDLDFSLAESEILNDLSANRAAGITILTDFNKALHSYDLDQVQGFAAFRSDLISQGADVSATFLDGAPIIYGTAGSDVIGAWAGNQTVIASQGGNDTLIGDGDNEIFYGSSVGDLFIGGLGNNEVFHGGNNNLWTGTPGTIDTFIAGQGTETFTESAFGSFEAYYAAGDGNLSLYAYQDAYGSDTLNLDSSISEYDVSVANVGGNKILTDGTAGDQVTIEYNIANLVFSDGFSIKLGSLGNIYQMSAGSSVSGGVYDDYYVYKAGEGHVTINDSSTENYLLFDSSISQSSLSYSTSGSDLLITDGVTGDQITVKNHSVQTALFTTGATTSLGATGNSYTLTGGTTCTGTIYNDTYSFASGTGAVTIHDTGGLHDVLAFGSGISASALSFQSSAQDLIVTDGVSGDEVVLQGELRNGRAIEKVTFSDGSSMTFTGLRLRAVTGVTELDGTSGNDTLFASSGTQTLIGNGGNDLFVGATGGHTTVIGDLGDDTFSFASGDGAYTISDNGGLNTLVLSGLSMSNISWTNSGSDLLVTDGVSGDIIDIEGQASADSVIDEVVFSDNGTSETLQGIAITATSGQAVLNGTIGDDTLTAASGHETLLGNGGDDTYIGSSGTEIMNADIWGGNNIFIIGTGTTTVDGSTGDDTYSYASGDGTLVINEMGGQNTIALGSGISLSNLTFTSSGHDLLMADGTSGDQITFKNQLNTNEEVQTLEFSSGSTFNLEGLSLTETSGSSFYGTAGDDTLVAASGTQTIYGNGGNDTFVVGAGPTTAIGGIGNDIYSYASGDGTLVIQDNAGTNTIVLGSGITTGAVSLTASGHDLLITDSVTGDHIDIVNQLTAQFGVSYLVFNGGTTEALEGISLTMPSGAPVLYGTEGNDTLTATGTLQSLVGEGGNDSFVGSTGSETMWGASGNDTFQGGSGTETMFGQGGSDVFLGGSGTQTMFGSTGTDTLVAGTSSLAAILAEGAAGNDLYSFASGSGAFTIFDNGGTDTLKLGSGLTESAVTFTETSDGEDLLMTDGVSGDQVELFDQFLTTADRTENIIFGDGSTVNLVTGGLAITAGSGSADLYGLGGNDTLYANTGTDTIFGEGGNDTFYGSSGTEWMYGSAANSDTFFGGTGNESLLGEGGTDTFYAGTSSTASILAEGSTGNDLYSYSSGDGKFEVFDNGVPLSTDTLKLGTGLTQSALTFTETTDGEDILITDGVVGDQVDLHDQFLNVNFRTEYIIFGDGSTLSLVTGGLAITAASGAAVLSGLGGNDTLYANTGTDTIFGNGGNDTFHGSSGTEWMYGSAANSDTFFGGTGLETLLGEGGTDTFFAGTSSTAAVLAEGLTGNDLYSYSSGDGAFTIFDTGGTDTLKLGTGLTASSISISETTNAANLLVTDSVSGDVIDIIGNAVETLIYGDGTSVNLLTGGLTLYAQPGNSTLNGGPGDDTLIATTQTSGHTETLYGGTTGNDTYSYLSGDGSVQIKDLGGTDTLKLGLGITSANLTFGETSNGLDLLITDGTAGDQIDLWDYLVTSNDRLETILFSDGSTMSLGTVILMAAPGTSTLIGTAGSDVLVGTAGTQTLKGNGGSDTFFAGTGTETLMGSTNGNDLYSYNSGDGNVSIIDGGGTDTLRLGSGLTESAVTFSETSDGEDLLMTDGVSGDQVDLHDQFLNTADRVENLIFGDGTTVSLVAGGLAITAGSGSAKLNGLGGNDTLYANTGADSIVGNGGNDTFYGSSGTEWMYGSAANSDTFFGGTGNESLLGEGGTDTFFAGTSSTASILAEGSTGNDLYSYSSGDGEFEVFDNGVALSTDTLKLGTGLTQSALTFTETADGEDILMTDGISGDQVDLHDQYLNVNYKTEYIVFGDGSTLSVATGGLKITAASGATAAVNGLGGNDTLYANTGTDTLNGLGGNDTFYGSSGSDSLNGSTGNDTFFGGTGTETMAGSSGNNSFFAGTASTAAISATASTGNDFYTYSSGDGGFTITDTGGTDTLKLGTGLTASNIWLGESANAWDVILTDGTAGDKVEIVTQLSVVADRIENFIFGDGSTLNLASVVGASTAATSVNGTTGADIFTPNTTNLTMAGKGGSDTYDFGSGMGKDYINNGVSTSNSAAGTLFFGHGIGDNQLWFDRVDGSGNISSTGNNLRITLMGTGSQITVNNEFNSSTAYAQLSEFQLSDSVLKLDSQLSNLVSAMATFETNYQTAHGVAFDPTSASNSSITDTTVLSAVSSDWHS